jgi:hypothetical protein
LLYEVEALGGSDGVFVGEALIVFARLNNSVSARACDRANVRPVALPPAVVRAPLGILESARAIWVVNSFIGFGFFTGR